MNHSIRHKFATMTALAAACTMMLATPAMAATDNTPAVSAPSAVDSSKRVIRRVQTGSTPAVSANTYTPQPSIEQGTAPVQIRAQQPSTSVYQRGPMNNTDMDISRGQLPNIPVPQARLSDISFVPTVLIPQTQGLGTDKLDVSLLDEFIAEASPNARHYPPNFPNRTQRHNTREKIKVMAEWIDPYASASNASYEVLLRAAKLNGMGRNLDLGSDFAVRGGQYIDRAIKAQPNSGEANFLYGFMLSEGGGFKEAEKYLNRAVALGYT
jgi:hypothetical protein